MRSSRTWEYKQNAKNSRGSHFQRATENNTEGTRGSGARCAAENTAPKPQSHLVTQLIDDPAERPWVETDRLVVAVLHAGNHRQHHVQVPAEQVSPVAVPVLRTAADDVDEIPHLNTNRDGRQYRVVYCKAQDGNRRNVAVR